MKECNKAIKIVVLYFNVSIYMYSPLHFREKYASLLLLYIYLAAIASRHFAD